MRDSVGRILAAYMRDISRVSNSMNFNEIIGPGNWLFTGTDDGLPKTDIPGARFTPDDLKSILSSVGRSRQALEPVIAAGLQFQRNSLIYALKHATIGQLREAAKGNELDTLSRSGTRSAKLMAFLVSGGIDGATADETERRERRAAIVDLMAGVAGMPDIPDKVFVKLAGGVGNNSLSDRMKKAASFARSQGQAKASDRLKQSSGDSVVKWKDSLDSAVRDSLELQIYNTLIARGALDHKIDSKNAPPRSILHKDPVTGKYDRLLTSVEAQRGGNVLIDQYTRWMNSHAPTWLSSQTVATFMSYV
jgi:hypothetical protein